MSETRSCWLHELKWPEIEAHLKGDDVALVPIGATEQHGLHLPLLTDTGWAIAAAEGAAARAGALEIFATGNVTVANCVFTDNVATGNSGGGALWIGQGGSTRVRNCTIVGNRATSQAA